eukprot:1023036-Amphidinium_carterae.1
MADAISATCIHTHTPTCYAWTESSHTEKELFQHSPQPPTSPSTLAEQAFEPITNRRLKLSLWGYSTAHLSWSGRALLTDKLCTSLSGDGA